MFRMTPVRFLPGEVDPTLRRSRQGLYQAYCQHLPWRNLTQLSAINKYKLKFIKVSKKQIEYLIKYPKLVSFLKISILRYQLTNKNGPSLRKVRPGAEWHDPRHLPAGGQHVWRPSGFSVENHRGPRWLEQKSIQRWTSCDNRLNAAKIVYICFFFYFFCHSHDS